MLIKTRIISMALLLILALAITNVNASQCVSYGTVNFDISSSYAKNKPIIVSPKIISQQNLVGLSATVQLLQKNIFDNNYQIVDQKPNLNIISGNSLQDVTFTNGVSRAEPIKFRLIIIDPSLPDGQISFDSPIAQIKNSLVITPSILPSIQNTGQDIVIELSIKDDLGQPITTPLSITATIQIGIDFVTPSSVTNREIHFKTPKTGYALAMISAEGVEYAKQESQITFELIKADVSQSIKINGVDYLSLDGGRITTGTKTLSVGIKEGTVLQKLDIVNLKIQRPDSGFDILTFSPKNSEKTEWTSSYNFISPDRPYTLTGTADNFETGKQYTISATFLTVGSDICDTDPSLPECQKEGIPFWVWILIGGVGIVLVAGIIFAFRRKR